MAGALVTSEVHDRRIHASRRRIVGGPIASTVVFAALAVLAFILGLAPLVGATFAAAGVVPTTVAVQRWSSLEGPPLQARRWAHNPKPERATKEVAGAATGQLRQAPLTGRDCVGYDVRIVWNGEQPTTPGAMALQEQAVDTLHVGKADASKAYVALKPERIPTANVLASPSAVRYLATRGLEPTDGAFDYYETVIVERDELVIKTDAGGRHEIVAA